MKHIIKHVKPDRHTEYMACSQSVDWVLQSFSDHLDDAFIVQEVYIENEVDAIKEVTHYFEAWHVINGVCEKETGQECDDLFCIGELLNDSGALEKSIGHKGKVTFVPRVFLVEKGSPLYNEVQFWTRNTVRESNGLRSCYYSDELAKKIFKHQEFFREPFCHKWKLNEPEKIYENVMKYCTKMFHNDEEIDRKNFLIAIDGFFPKGIYQAIRQRVVKEWEKE